MNHLLKLLEDAVVVYRARKLRANARIVDGRCLHVTRQLQLLTVSQFHASPSQVLNFPVPASEGVRRRAVGRRWVEPQEAKLGAVVPLVPRSPGLAGGAQVRGGRAFRRLAGSIEQRARGG